MVDDVIVGLPSARALLQLLGAAGDPGVRLDQMPDDLRAPRLLTVLDGAELIEFGQRQHCSNGIGELMIESGFWWKSWLGPNTKPIEAFLPELLERVPETLRPWCRLTSQGRLAAARISLETPVQTKRRSGVELDEEAKVLRWGSKSFSGLTPKMIKVLSVFVDDFLKGGFGLSIAAIKTRSGETFDGSFKNQVFKLNRKTGPRIHEVAEIVETVSPGVYKLQSPPS